MAFATKYRATFTQLVGPSEVVTDYTIYFKKDGYSGGVTDLLFSGDAITAKIVNTEDSIIGIKEKKINIAFLSDLELSDLQLAKPKEWLVQITSTVNTTTTDDFIGYLSPTSAQTDYVDGIKPIRLEAIDGLTILKSIDFVDNDSVYYEGLTTVFEAVRLCLLKIGTNLRLNTINNTFGVGHDTADTAEALKQRSIDLDLYRGTNEPLKTYKVLSEICISEKCRLYQENGEWWLENVNEKIIDGQVKSREYTLSDGVRVSSGTLDCRISAVYNSTSYKPMGGGTTSANKPLKYVKIEHKLGPFKNQLLNRDFRVWSGSEFENWTRNGTGVTRVGDGTSGNPYGVKINGFVNKSKDATSIYQTIILGTAAAGTTAEALQKNVVFSGQAYTQDIESALVRCYLQIVTFDYGSYVFGLNDSGEWVRNGADIAMKNSDVNNHSKKTPVTWNVTSKRIGDVKPVSVTGATIPWESNINRVEVIMHLMQGVGQLSPYPGETQNSNVWYKSINLGWVNADMNLNLKQINYKASNLDTADIDETYEAIYGDYADGANLSALKNNDGSVTKLWTSPTESVAKNFHAIGAVDLLNARRETQKVYDGDIWGKVLYRHSIAMAGFTRRGYVVSWEYNYATSFTTVRVVEHQTNAGIDVKKTGLLSDGTEIDMVGETTPSPHIGSNKGELVNPNRPDSAENWLKRVLGGIFGRTVDDSPIGVVWDKIVGEDLFDLGTIVKRGGKTAIGSDGDDIAVGSSEKNNKFELLGGSLQIGVNPDNLFADTSNVNEDGSLSDARIRYDGDLFQAGGDLGVARQFNVGQTFTIEKTLVEGDIYETTIKNINENIKIDAPVTNVTNILGVNHIGGIGTAGINAQGVWSFAQPLNIVDGTSPNQAVTRQLFYSTVEALAAGGNKYYGFVYCATTENITLSGSQVIDGVTPPDGEKVLVHRQTNPAENFIYIVNYAGAWTRVTDLLDSNDEIHQQISVNTGATQLSSMWVSDTEGEIVLGTTAVSFKMIYQQFAAPYLAYRTGPQTFYGVQQFLGQLKTELPVDNDDVATKLYVDNLRTYVDNGITGLGQIYWPKLVFSGVTNGIGTTGNNDLEIITNGVKRGFFSKTGGLSLDGYLQIGGGADIKGSISLGHRGASSVSSYNLDLIRGAGRSAVRFGNYISGAGPGATNQIKRGIEFDEYRNLIIGTYDSDFTNLEKTFNPDKSTTFKENGNVGFGVVLPDERVDILGNLQFSGVLKPSGNAPTEDGQFFVSDGTTGNKYIRFSEFGKFQAHEQYGNIYDAPFGASFIAGATLTNLPDAVTHGHIIKMSIGLEHPDQATYLSIKRPFLGGFDGKIYVRGVYGDEDSGWLAVGGGDVQDYDFVYDEYDDKRRGIYYESVLGTREAFFGIDRVAGGLFMELNVASLTDSTNKTYKNKMSIDNGRLYYVDGDGLEKQYLIEGEGGTGGGVSYTFESPLYPDGSTIKVYTANNSRTGVLTAADWVTFNGKQNALSNASGSVSGILTSTDWTRFDAKLGQGSTVTSNLKFAFFSPLKFMASNGTDEIGKIYSTNTGVDALYIQSNGEMQVNALNGLYLTGGSSDFVHINNVAFDMSNASTLVGSNAKFYITNLGGGKFKATLVAA